MTKLIKCDACGRTYLASEFASKFFSRDNQDFCDECLTKALDLLRESIRVKGVLAGERK